MSDYIDRQAAIEAIERLIFPQTKGETMAEEINRVAWRCAINCAEEMIGHLPPAEVELVKRGTKKVYYHGEATFSYSCGVCAMPIDGNDTYCRWCGAKLDAEEPV